jgi:hypothetical protein
MAGTIIQWRLHLRSNPDVVCRTLTTPEGRASFWAEAAEESGGYIRFRFANGQTLDSREAPMILRPLFGPIPKRAR